MQLMIGFKAEIPDKVAVALLAKAGPNIHPDDVPLALALAVIQPFPPQIRELLLTDGHDAVPLDTPTLLTTERSAIEVTLMITTDDKDHPVWNTTTKPQPSSSETLPKRQAAARKPAPSRSASKSPSRKRTGKRTSRS